ncbi:hypothetical protein ER13_08315 [Brevundimonas sp. EAKA]|uniref:hypothetical protein n=1 Tax=Brevundimonas sp. EAKA TaxID=1495854 RepID=UPI0004A8EE66|nr:hypothetical protein [Brevundimonas sp. EAKA]KDP94939.1 hypothetical protein ER13_08315 [Brevundimonas sp. EAKA]
MARSSWTKGEPLDAFTSGYRPHRTDRRAIHEWTVARLRRLAPEQIRERLDEGMRKASGALAAFATMSPTAKVKRAKANAKAHKNWIWMIRAELDRLHPRSTGRAATRPRRKPRPGYLQTEAKAFQAAHSKRRAQ